jgi:hypothetical protein
MSAVHGPLQSGNHILPDVRRPLNVLITVPVLDRQLHHIQPELSRDIVHDLARHDRKLPRIRRNQGILADRVDQAR